MIEWMQTHRKWLVITIWIATIAFIGAGFVGWGQFQFGKSQATVAKVGNTEVTIQDVQDAYQRIYEETNQRLGGKLDEDLAKKLGLQKKALDQAIQMGLLRQYAKDLGLTVTDEDIAKKILSTFGNEKTYKQYLRNIGEKPANFEKKLRKTLLIEKLLTFLETEPTNTELNTMASALYNADNVSIKVFDKSSMKITLTEDEIRAFWEKNKKMFLTPNKYKIALVTIPLKGDVNDKELKEYYEENKNEFKNEKGEILPFEQAKEKVKAKYLQKKLFKNAIIAYKKLKNGELNDYKLIEVSKENKYIPQEKMQQLIQNGYLKPFVYNNSYQIAQLIEEIKPMPKKFEEAKDEVTKMLLNQKANELLIKTVKNYNGELKNVGFVTKYDENKFPQLTPVMATAFLFNLFTTQNPKGYFILPSEKNPQVGIVYNILAQKLLDKEKYEKNKEYVYNLTKTLLNNELITDLLEELQNKYEIVTYVK